MRGNLYSNPQQWKRIRARILEHADSIRHVAADEGMSRLTVRKILRYEKPPVYNLTNRVTISKDKLEKSNYPIKIDAYTKHKQHWMEWLYEIEKNGLYPRYASLPQIEYLQKALLIQKNNYRKRTLTILANLEGFKNTSIAEHLGISRSTARKYFLDYKNAGVTAAFSRKEKTHKADDSEFKSQVFKLLHEPPTLYGLNSTSWKMSELISVLKNYGYFVCAPVVREVIRKAGYKWRTAKVVLTSNDPEYREKYQKIQEILSGLKEDERFFSIDEYGPFAIKMKAGRRLSPPEVYPTVPQWQKSKGWLILTAALELSSNQVTHFYSKAKNTDEMIKMIETLAITYAGESKLYISWDAASWHMSKKLKTFIENHNENTLKSNNLFPKIELAPLPASAQFLNVIESVFSGMARSIIHNSDYASTDEAKKAMDNYFSKRNKDFIENPKRAGNKIWGLERTNSEFSDSNNCKDPSYR